MSVSPQFPLSNTQLFTLSPVHVSPLSACPLSHLPHILDMPVNTLTTQAGLKIGPIVFETLLKHYFERFKNSQTHAEGSTLLRKEELLYDEAFNVCKVSRRFR